MREFVSTQIMLRERSSGLKNLNHIQDYHTQTSSAAYCIIQLRGQASATGRPSLKFGGEPHMTIKAFSKPNMYLHIKAPGVDC